MKLTAFSLCALLCSGATLFLICATAEDKPAAGADKAPPASAAAPDMAGMMKKWEAAATPGAPHKALDALAGEWDIAGKWWIAPEAPPMESKGTSKTHWILGGRFLQEDYAGEFIGKPMKGLGLIGYDNFRRHYVSVWLDESGTGMFTSVGRASADGKRFLFEGKMDDPATGEKDKLIKYVIRIVSPDKHVLEMHELSRGEKSLMAETTYTRK